MNKTNKLFFCTFADSRMSKTLQRIDRQAREMDFFDEIYIYNESSLDSDFCEYFKDKLIKGTRGYGYWVWKPQIILQTLEKMNEGDILLYADAGCHLNKDGIERLKYYFNETDKSDSGLLVFQEAVESDNKDLDIIYSNLERKYTKGDIFKHFNVQNSADVYDSGIIAATTFFIKKEKNAVEIIEKWLEIFKKDFNLVDDSDSQSDNFPDFIENRHDQSIFSILCKINKVKTISAYEIWQEDWSKLKDYPIHAKRDKKINLYLKFKQKLFCIVKKNKKVKKFLEANNHKRKELLVSFIMRTYLSLLPLFRIFIWPFANKKQKVNVCWDFIERITKAGPELRYRYYLDFKVFYRCLSKVDTGVANDITCNRIYEKETSYFLENSLKNIPNPNFIDIGANIGLISLYMLRKVKDIKIYSFEPSPIQYDLFKKTINHNRIADKIELSNLAISDTVGEVQFYTHKTGGPADGFKNTGRGGDGDFIKVSTTTLDTWWELNGKPKIDLIKVDTEGSELLVFKGAKRLIIECKPIIFFEMQEVNYRVYDYTVKDILTFFKSIGFSVFTEKGDHLNNGNSKELMTDSYNFIARFIK